MSELSFTSLLSTIVLVRHCCVLTNMYFYIHSCHWFHVLALWMQPLGLYNNTEACKSSQIHQCSRIFLQCRPHRCHNPRHLLSKKGREKDLCVLLSFGKFFVEDAQMKFPCCDDSYLTSMGETSCRQSRRQSRTVESIRKDS